MNIRNPIVALGLASIPYYILYGYDLVKNFNEPQVETLAELEAIVIKEAVKLDLDPDRVMPILIDRPMSRGLRADTPNTLITVGRPFANAPRIRELLYKHKHERKNESNDTIMVDILKEFGYWFGLHPKALIYAHTGLELP